MKHILWGVLLMLTFACKKDKLEEDNLQPVIDFHLAEVIHHSLEIGLLPQFKEGYQSLDLSLYSNLLLDSMFITAENPSEVNPHTYFFSYHHEINNPTGRNLSGNVQVTYYGTAVDSMLVTIENVIIGGLKTTATIAYYHLSASSTHGDSEVSILLDNKAVITMTNKRTIRTVLVEENTYTKQIVTIIGEGKDRLGQDFDVKSNSGLTRYYGCKNFYKANMTINVTDLPNKTVTYPEACNDASVVNSQDQLTNIVFY